MQAIITKYHGPTDAMGARVSATAECGKRVRIPYDHSLPRYGSHDEAAKALIDKLGWPRGRWIRGGTKTGFVFVADPQSEHGAPLDMVS